MWGGWLFYSVARKGLILLDQSPLGLVTRAVDLTQCLSFAEAAYGEVDESYAPTTGKMASYSHRAREMRLSFRRDDGRLDLVFRACDDGIALRYLLPGNGNIEVTAEETGFSLPTGELVNVWAKEFHSSNENTYDFHALEDLRAEHYGLPMLFRTAAGWMLITEAAVYGDYCASNLAGIAGDGRTLSLSFPPDQDVPIRCDGPLATPWRVVMAGDDLNTIVRSTLVEGLNPPAELPDTSRIRPGRSSWPWFTEKSSCADLEANRRYVDFTAAMGWEYLLVDAGWEGKLPVAELVRYAAPKGVGIWLWAHSRDFQTEDAVRERLRLWAGWGIKGVKIDFFESDSQRMLAVYDLIARTAAEFRLMVNYHGCTKPAGERRRWPHIMTREGVLGAEYFGADWSWCELHPLGPTAEHNCTLPFTRNVVGPMDYTPVHFLKGKRRTTYAHQVALAVVFESGVQHYPDSIEAYETCLARDFLAAVPAAWDDTILLEGYPGRYATLARKKGDQWFVGAISAVSGRKAVIPLHFLDGGAYTATIYEDGPNWNNIKLLNAAEIYRREVRVSREDSLEVALKKNGGCAVHIVRS